MTSAQDVETSVTKNSSFQNYTHPDDHIIRTIFFCILNTSKTVTCRLALFCLKFWKPTTCLWLSILTVNKSQDFETCINLQQSQSIWQCYVMNVEHNFILLQAVHTTTCFLIHLLIGGPAYMLYMLAITFVLPHSNDSRSCIYWLEFKHWTLEWSACI